MGSPDEDNTPIELIDVTPFSLGVCAIDEDHPARYINSIIINKNSLVPCLEVNPYKLTTKPNQDNQLQIYMLQGESRDPMECLMIGKYSFNNISHGANSPAIIDIEYGYDHSGIITISAQDRSTGHVLPYIIESVIEGREWGLGVNSKIPVEQKLANYGRDAQGLVPIAKKAEAALKQMGLGEHVAAVALVLDISGSMNAMFEDGTVQKVIERVMGLGLNFDDNGAIDIFAFAMDAFDLGEITPDKFSNAAEGVKKSVHSKLTAQTNTESERHKWTGNIIWKEIPGIIWGDIDMWGTQYSPAILNVMSHYGCQKGLVKGVFGAGFSGAKLPAEQPVYVLFVTDGECVDYAEAEVAIKKAARFPIFFQFFGIGESSFAFLKKLDKMRGRLIDNANFFEVKNPNRISDNKLYKKMMAEYPDWLKLAKGKGLIL